MTTMDATKDYRVSSEQYDREVEAGAKAFAAKANGVYRSETLDRAYRDMARIFKGALVK